MADALLSPFLDQLASAIRKMVEHEVRLVDGVDNAVESLKKNLLAIKVVLQDAEKRQWKDEAVKLWMDDLKDVSYDMDDVLDEWSTAILKSEIDKEDNGVDQNASFAEKIKVCVSALCCCFHSGPLGQLHTRHDIAHKIENLNGRIDDIANRKEKFSFHLTTRIDEPRSRPNFSTSIIDVPVVYGQDNKIKLVVDHLLCTTSSQEQRGLYIIPVVGMGGIGKTTVAKQVYNDDQVINHFSVRAWVCVSDPFDRFEIAKAIVKQVTGQTLPDVDPETLMQTFHASIKDKKFLIVLDDVWSSDAQEWGPLENDLRSGAVGSRIVVTTRKKEVAKMMGDTHMVSIEQLSEEDCWSLFKEIAFFGKTEEEKEDLKQIGERIARKCKGLPLAVKTLGGLLRTKSKDEWQEVFGSELWELDKVNFEKIKKNLLSPLLLSYYDLPPAQKRCFSYCAIFPKDYTIEVKFLIRQWMAQGYFSSKNDETEGQKCFENLAMRSFFQDFQYDEVDGVIERCRMHDIVRDFAQILTLNEFSVLSINEGQNFKPINARHLRLHATFSPTGEIPVSILCRKNLHTLVLAKGSKIDKFRPDNFLFLRCLRTLALCHCGIKQLPEDIGHELILLRYLDLSNNQLTNLPNTIGDLHHLQTLVLDYCGGFGLNFDRFPKGIGKLKNLRALSGVVISPNDYDKFQPTDLNDLNNLRDLGLRELGTEELHVLDGAILTNKTNLCSLELSFSTLGHSKSHEAVLEALRPHQNLQDLFIKKYTGGVFPNWMIKLTNLKVLDLCHCTGCHFFPPLGKLPSLEALLLYHFPSVNKVGPEFLGLDDKSIGYGMASSEEMSFPKLKRLQFQRMSSWSEWAGIPGWNVRVMPRLEFLMFFYCTKLEALPDFLQTTTLKHLIIEVSPKLANWLCQKETGDEWTKIRNIT